MTRMAAWTHRSLDQEGSSMANDNIDGSTQQRCNSSALAMELHLSCTNPLISTPSSPMTTDTISFILIEHHCVNTILYTVTTSFIIAVASYCWNNDLRADSIWSCHLTSMGNPIIKIKWSQGCPSFIMGICNLIEQCLYTGSAHLFTKVHIYQYAKMSICFSESLKIMMLMFQRMLIFKLTETIRLHMFKHECHYNHNQWG